MQTRLVCPDDPVQICRLLKSFYMRQFVFGIAVIVVATAGCSPKNRAPIEPGIMPPAAEKQGVTYVTDIKAIFDNNCIKCHGAKKQKAGLRLDSREAAIHGSEDGPVFEIGISAESHLVTSVARTVKEDDWMPPVDENKPLSLEQVALIRAWIDQGAK